MARRVSNSRGIPFDELLEKREGNGFSQRKGKFYFLGIAVDNYEKIEALNNAVKDVQEVGEILEKDYFFDTQFLLNSEVTEANFENRIIELQTKLGRDDSLVIYFAGHGRYKKIGDSNNGFGYWCAYNYDEKIESGRIMQKHIITFVGDTLNVNNILIIEDRCFGGTALEEFKWSLDHGSESNKGKKFLVLSSTSKDSSAQDGDFGDNSPFAIILKRALLENQEEELHFSDKIIGGNFGESIKFYSLFPGEVKDFVLYKNVKHYFFDEKYIWERRPKEDPYWLMKFLLNFPRSKYSEDVIDLLVKTKKDNENISWEKLAQISGLLAEYIYKNPTSVNKEVEIQSFKCLRSINPDLGEYIDGPKMRGFFDLISESLKDFFYSKVVVTHPTGNQLGAVDFSHSFEIGKHPVTIEMFQKFSIDFFGENYIEKLETVKRGAPWGISDLMPAININWLEAIQFANWLSDKHGFEPYYKLVGEFLGGINEGANGYRLPTKMEWEWAAKGGSLENEYDYSGSNSPEEVAWFADNSSNELKKVGLLKPNELEIYDMSGNIFEWCYDIYNKEKDSIYRYAKGGAFSSIKEQTKISEDAFFPQKDGSIYLGFRLVRSIYQ